MVVPRWMPTKIYDMLQEPLGTSTAPFIVSTDAGDAYIKVLGNPEGPTALACELVGTRLAAWLGLPVFEAVVLDFPNGFDVDLGHDCRALPGPAFLTRKVIGRPWGGDGEDLALLHNPDALAGLVVLDTWLRNPDRCRPGAEKGNWRNVFFREEPGPLQVLAIDHTECIRCGRELTPRQLGIDQEKEAATYGLFPAFVPYVTERSASPFVRRLSSFSRSAAVEVVQETPAAWVGSADLRERLPEFCASRAAFVAANIMSWLARACAWQTVSPRGS